MAERPNIVCVTPVKNEACMLERFLRCASLWADHIVIADQGSTDGSREIAARFPKVMLVDNPQSEYDEGGRQRLLLEAARRIDPPRVIVALDADEVLSATWEGSPEWEALLGAAPGTVAWFDWVNLLPGLDRCWIPPERVPFAFVDDGSEHAGDAIHSTRLPTPDGAAELGMDGVKVLHFQHVDGARMDSKQRWYQCWEVVHNPRKRPTQIYRQYHWMDALPEAEIRPIDPSWLAGYEARGIDVTTVPDAAPWWDAEVLDLLAEHGPERFRRLDLWDVDWSAVAGRLGRDLPDSVTRDPRSRFERAVHDWLRRTQRRQLEQRRVRWLQRLLIPLGW